MYINLIHSQDTMEASLLNQEAAYIHLKWELCIIHEISILLPTPIDVH